jgi:carbonic anhydrase
VQQAIEVLKQHPAVRKAASERGLTLHGMIYDLGKGQLRVLDEALGQGENSLCSAP